MREAFHPGGILRERRLDGISADRAAVRIGASPEVFEGVPGGAGSSTPELARTMEAAGWSAAGLRPDLRADCDAAGSRQRAA